VAELLDSFSGELLLKTGERVPFTFIPVEGYQVAGGRPGTIPGIGSFTAGVADFPAEWVAPDGRIVLGGFVRFSGAQPGGGGISAVTVYSPGAQQVYSTASAVLADVDAANLAVTFTAPASGNVLVQATCWIDSNTPGQRGRLGLREGSSNIGQPVSVTRDADNGYLVTASFSVTGLSAGSHTYKLSFATNAGTFRIIVFDSSSGNFPQATLVVFSA
jgi:hypothetical protein